MPEDISGRIRTKSNASDNISTESALHKSILTQKFMKIAVNNINVDRYRADRTLNRMRFSSLPRIIPFVDWDYYYIDGPLAWLPSIESDIAPVSLPKGFVTDLASVPSMLWSVLPPIGRYAYAAVVHDFLYWYQPRPRAEADKIMAAAMQDAMVPAETIAAFFAALRFAGDSAWNDNAQARAAGEKRVLKEFPDDPLISWSDWKRRHNVFEE